LQKSCGAERVHQLQRSVFDSALLPGGPVKLFLGPPANPSSQIRVVFLEEGQHVYD
jgi:hypothetical protein